MSEMVVYTISSKGSREYEEAENVREALEIVKELLNESQIGAENVREALEIVKELLNESQIGEVVTIEIEGADDG